MTAPAWLVDPHNQNQVRWFDGEQWTSATAPIQHQQQPAFFTAQQSVIVNNRRGGCNHGLHFVLTILTCGLWLPVWILCAIVQ